MEGSRTMTLLAPPSTVRTLNDDAATAVLERRFRILRVTQPRRVTWQEGTIDNEGQHKKSSKCCCVFTRRQRYEDESSDGRA
ncbi:protein phosphatase inhibitor family protein, putative [Babesia bigemina]|uniref:Protein phosphatase inhibitor family protein, putative n=1 Tax=Babesia bigemina TaxID=5866 RepID=A0A061D9T6_BABBI|nr:protein phosphatase inhibitor family protein, putative [Babesia bigemina]CDR97283.1 protein phosphatase inhibitor family protein, putative [Babesia bigemina]|eukprot:XP_012769469.1 protein phosphatase inhibitor family protein, putative [Babesia bigemina]